MKRFSFLFRNDKFVPNSFLKTLQIYGMKRSSLKGKLLFENLVHSSTRARKKSFIINRFSPLLLGISYSHARIRLYRAYPTECDVHVHEREKNYNFVARSFPFPFSLFPPPTVRKYRFYSSRLICKWNGINGCLSLRRRRRVGRRERAECPGGNRAG